MEEMRAEVGQAVALGPDVRRILAPNPSPFTGPGTNTYLVGEGDGLAVIDPGPADASHLAAILSAAGGAARIGHILVTHPHADHSALAPALAAATGAPVSGFGPAGSGRSKAMRALAATGGLRGGEGADVAFAPDIRLVEGAVVAGDGWRLTVLHTPGHMAEHLAFALGDTLFSGDQVMGWASSLISPPDGDMGAYMASLARLEAGDWRRLLPGHGAPVDAPRPRIAALIAHRHAREAEILATLDAGPLPLAAITARVYADTPAHLHPAAARNAFAHLVDLHGKGRVSAHPSLSPSAHFARR